MTLDITGLGSVADLATSIVNKIWPDKSAQEQAQIAAAVAMVQGQLDTNKAEAGNASSFTSGWRPAIGWVCALALAFQYIARPLVGSIFAVAGHAPPVLPGIDGNLWELMMGMLGLGGLHTYDKIKGVE